VLKGVEIVSTELNRVTSDNEKTFKIE